MGQPDHRQPDAEQNFSHEAAFLDGVAIRGIGGEEASPISLIAGADGSAEWPGYLEGAIRSGRAAAAVTAAL